LSEGEALERKIHLLLHQDTKMKPEMTSSTTSTTTTTSSSSRKQQLALVAIFLASCGGCTTAFSPVISLRSKNLQKYDPTTSRDYQRCRNHRISSPSNDDDSISSSSGSSASSTNLYATPPKKKKSRKEFVSPKTLANLMKKDRLPFEVESPPGRMDARAGMNPTKAMWMSWMRAGKPRGVEEIKMREAMELGGLPRSDRYSSK